MKQPVNPEEYYKFIKPVVFEVGKYLEKNHRNIYVVKSKRDALDIQTNIDLGAEKIYFEAIRSKFPGHTIISEENQIRNKSDFVWYIDPLDGTKEYFNNISIYNTSLILEYKKQNLLSLVYRPIDRELFYSFNEKSWLNNKLCYLSKVNNLNVATIYCRFPTLQSSFSESTLDKSYEIIKSIAKKTYRLRNLAGDANSMISFVASGKCEAFIDLYNPLGGWWDIAPGVFIAENAGAIVTNIHGEKIIKNNFSDGFIVANKFLHQELLDLVQKS